VFDSTSESKAMRMVFAFFPDEMECTASDIEAVFLDPWEG
jgi:hypothetical protein